MSFPTQCPHCSAALPVPTHGSAIENCPLCQKPLREAGNGKSPARGDAWWLGGSGGSTAAAITTTSILEKPVETTEHSPISSSGGEAWLLGVLALLLSFAGFGLAWLPRFTMFGMVFGALGLLFGLVGAATLARRQGSDRLSLAGICSGLLAGTFAAAVHFGFAHVGESPTTPPPDAVPPRTVERVRSVVVDPAALLERINSKDVDERSKAVAALGEVTAGLGEFVPVLTDRMLNEKDAHLVAAFATALGNLGPQARPAYLALLTIKTNDHDKAVQGAAAAAMEKIGGPSVFDVPQIVKGLEDSRADYRAAVAQMLSLVCTPDNKAVAPLIKSALTDSDPRVKFYAAQALWRIDRQPHEVMHVFRDCLHDRTDAIRSGAAFGLALLGAEAALAQSELVRALADGDVHVRLYASMALWNIKPEQETADMVVPVLGSLLKATDEAIRAEAARTLVRIGPRAKPATQQLTEGLADAANNPDVRALCAVALGNIGPGVSTEAVRALASAVQGAGGNLAEQAAFALQLIGRKAVSALPELVEALKGPNVAMRARAALALAAIGDGAKPAAPALTEALAANRDPTLRVVIVQALWAVDQKRETVLPVLLELLEDDKVPVRVRIEAANELGKMESAAKVALLALDQVSRRENDASLRGAIGAAIDRIGVVTPDDVKDMVKALDSPSVAYRKAALQTLGGLGPAAKDHVGAIRKALQQSDVGIRLAAAEALARIGPDAKDAVPDLADALNHPDAALRGTALEALGQIGLAAKDSLDAILKRANDVDPRVRARALTTAVAIAGDEGAVQRAVVDRLKDEDGLIRVVAANYHWNLKHRADDVLPILTKALDDPNHEVRLLAVHVLGEMGTAAREAAARVAALKKDPNETVRNMAVEAVKRLEGKGKQ